MQPSACVVLTLLVSWAQSSAWRVPAFPLFVVQSSAWKVLVSPVSWVQSLACVVLMPPAFAAKLSACAVLAFPEAWMMMRIAHCDTTLSACALASYRVLVAPAFPERQFLAFHSHWSRVYVKPELSHFCG